MQQKKNSLMILGAFIIVAACLLAYALFKTAPEPETEPETSRTLEFGEMHTIRSTEDESQTAADPAQTSTVPEEAESGVADDEEEADISDIQPTVMMYGAAANSVGQAFASTEEFLKQCLEEGGLDPAMADTQTKLYEACTPLHYSETLFGDLIFYKDENGRVIDTAVYSSNNAAVGIRNGEAVQDTVGSFGLNFSFGRPYQKGFDHIDDNAGMYQDQSYRHLEFQDFPDLYIDLIDGKLDELKTVISDEACKYVPPAPDAVMIVRNVEAGRWEGTVLFNVFVPALKVNLNVAYRTATGMFDIIS